MAYQIQKHCANVEHVIYEKNEVRQQSPLFLLKIINNSILTGNRR